MRCTWYDARRDEVWDFEPTAPELRESDNPVVGTLLGPDGAVAIEVTERQRRPFGFQPGGRR